MLLLELPISRRKTQKKNFSLSLNVRLEVPFHIQAGIHLRPREGKELEKVVLLPPLRVYYLHMSGSQEGIHK